MGNVYRENARQAMRENKAEWKALGLSPEAILEAAEENVGLVHTKWAWQSWQSLTEAIRNYNDPIGRGTLKFVNRKSTLAAIRNLQRSKYVPAGNGCTNCGSISCGTGSTGLRCNV